MGRLRVCFEYISFSPFPSSDTLDLKSCDIYMSAEVLRCIMDIGGDWSTIAGSPWLMNESGETEGGIIPDWSPIGFGERKGTVKGVLLYDEAGKAPESGP